MKFDPGEVLQRAWQITWKHRVLWVFAMLPLLPFVFVLPFVLYFLLSTDFANGSPAFFEDPNLLILFFAGILLLAGISFALQIFSASSSASGIFQAETGQGAVTFPEVAARGRDAFGRILAAVLLVGVGTMAFFAVFSACLSVLGLVTFGLGSLFGQILFLPAVLAAYALAEQTQAAIVADGLRPTEALARAWQLLQENVHVYALVAGVLYFGLSFFSSLASLPVIAPLFLAVFGRFASDSPNSSTLWIGMVCFVALLPVYVLLQAGAMLYMKAVFMLTYLRLTRSSQLQPLHAQ